MKRDMDLVRKLLFTIEDTADVIDGEPEIDGYTSAQVAYNVTLLDEAQLTRASFDSGYVVAVERLTWAGHEFVDASRDPSRWEIAKSIAAAKGGADSLEAIRTALCELTQIGVRAAVAASVAA